MTTLKVIFPLFFFFFFAKTPNKRMRRTIRSKADEVNEFGLEDRVIVLDGKLLTSLLHL
jgi:hypothetical protein